MPSIEIQRLRPCRAFRGMSDEQIGAIAAELTWHELQPKQPVSLAGEPLLELHTVTRGRLRIYRDDVGRDQFIGFANMGETIGQASLLSAEMETISQVVADIASQVGSLQRDAALHFIREIPRFRENLFAGFGRRLTKAIGGEQFRRIPRIVGLVGFDPKSQKLVALLANRLAQLGECFHVFTDRVDNYLTDRDATMLPDVGELRRAVRERLAENNRVLVHITDFSPDVIQHAVEECDEVLWCCNNDNPNHDSEALLAALVQANPQLRSSIVGVQITSARQLVGRRRPCCAALAQRDFIVPIDEPTPEIMRLQPAAIDRIVRHLRGIRIGIALGGGGARGLSHLGVLKVLDRAGLSFDLMSGTSAGAMIGLGYAVGLSPNFLIESFTKTLQPPEFFEAIPGGRRLFLFAKFLQHAWEEMLREYYGDWTFEQLPIPFSVVTTDLVAGAELVRDSGDLVDAILESINVPMMSEPILKNGKVLVDGGVLNNLPIDQLTHRGAEFVIAVDASKEIPNHFAGNYPDTPTDKMRIPGRLETAYRVMEVSRRGIAQLQMSMADVVIEPDTSAFDFADFAAAAQIAEMGEKAAEQVLPEIQRSYERLMKD